MINLTLLVSKPVKYDEFPGSAEPGNSSYLTGLDTNRVRLITDYGDHYVMPRFQINSTDSSMIFLSKNDHLEVGSFVTFRVSSSGAPELLTRNVTNDPTSK